MHQCLSSTVLLYMVELQYFNIRYMFGSLVVVNLGVWPPPKAHNINLRSCEMIKVGGKKIKKEEESSTKHIWTFFNYFRFIFL